MFDPIHKISDGIFLGNEDAHKDEKTLKENKIGAILTCAGELKGHKYEDLEVERKAIDVIDYQGENIAMYFDEAVEWMEKMLEGGKNIFIHCAAGVSRSGSFTIAYFMKSKNMSFKEAFLFVKSKRRCVKPNSGFHEQLIAYEKKLSGSK